MKIQKARMDVINACHQVVEMKAAYLALDGPEDYFDLTVNQTDQGLRATLRTYRHDPELAASLHYEGEVVVRDWFEIHNVTTTVYSDSKGTRLTLIGYQHGTEGIVRDGKNTTEDNGHATGFDILDRPLIKVRWDLW